MHFQDGITLVTGILLALIPFVVAIAPPNGRSTMLVTANFLLSGAAAAVLGVAAMFFFQIWEEWLDMALGAWLIASPWACRFHLRAGSDVVCDCRRCCDRGYGNLAHA